MCRQGLGQRVTFCQGSQGIEERAAMGLPEVVVVVVVVVRVVAVRLLFS
jgi:hypothetical protein